MSVDCLGRASYAASGVSDKAFTTDLLNYLKSKYCIDSNRIYASGMSNGGGFVSTLACSLAYGSDFAAFAPVAGAFYTDVNNRTCKPAQVPLPILEFHGTNDTVIPYNGGNGAGGAVPAIPDWLSRWAVRNGCSDPPTASAMHNHTSRNHTRVTYSCNGDKDIVDHYKLIGMGHSWPNVSRRTAGIDATPRILEFFEANAKS